MLNSADIKVMVPLSYAIPSFMMSTSIVIVILRSFKAPFYRLFAVAAMTVRVYRNGRTTFWCAKMAKNFFFVNLYFKCVANQNLAAIFYVVF